MRNLNLLSLLLLLHLSACDKSAKKPTENEQLNIGNSPKKAKQVVYSFDNAVLIDSSDYVIYPLSNKTSNDDDSFITKSSGGSISYWNIVFYNSATKKYHLLDEKRKMIITSFGGQKLSIGSDADALSGGSDGAGNLIFYSVIVSDFNNDGKLNYDDPEYLFISDKAGNNFRQISPDNMNVVSWQVNKKTGKVFIQAITDVDNNKKFNSEDRTVPYVYDMKVGGMAEPVFSDGFNAGVDRLFEKEWPHKK
jgi:hypothetical protein